MCDIPNLQSWTGTSVRWKGVVLGTFHHGFGLVAEDCSGLVPLDGWTKVPGGSALDQALEETWLKSGLLHAELSGKIIGEGERQRLWVTDVHHLKFEPMSDEEERDYWDSKSRANGRASPPQEREIRF